MNTLNNPRFISVVVCTYNRAQSMAKTLESLVVQTVPAGTKWEIVVVDNNSKDETRQVIGEFQSRNPGQIRYVFEERQGISNARNAGIAACQGDVFAFIDDDEIAAVDWLECITADLWEGKWVGTGGPIVPNWDCPRPRWLQEKNTFLMGPLCAFDYEPAVGSEQEMTEPPFGANMAFRREAFDRVGGFRTDLGRVGNNLLSNEDTEFGRRLFAAGMRIRWVQSAITYHHIDKRRVNKRYFLKWWFNKGASDVREFGYEYPSMKLLGVPLRLVLDAAKEGIRWVITTSPSRRAICLLKIWTYAGQGYECHRRFSQSKVKRSVAQIAS
jgi:glycosyltransferase involved in cell wall biosynthesis